MTRRQNKDTKEVIQVTLDVHLTYTSRSQRRSALAELRKSLGLTVSSSGEGDGGSYDLRTGKVKVIEPNKEKS